MLTTWFNTYAYRVYIRVDFTELEQCSHKGDNLYNTYLTYIIRISRINNGDNLYNTYLTFHMFYFCFFMCSFLFLFTYFVHNRQRRGVDHDVPQHLPFFMCSFSFLFTCSQQATKRRGPRRTSSPSTFVSLTRCPK